MSPRLQLRAQAVDHFRLQHHPRKLSILACQALSPSHGGVAEQARALFQHGPLDCALRTVQARLEQHNSTIPMVTYAFLLKACSKAKSLPHTFGVLALFSEHSQVLSPLVGDLLLAALSKCGAPLDAHCVLLSLPQRSVYSWTAIISGYVTCGQGRQALATYDDMTQDGVEPDEYTFVSLFKACSLVADVARASKLHTDAVSKGFVTNVYVGSALISAYAKCGNIQEAENVFAGLSHQTVVSCTTMLSAYVEHGNAKKALQLYRQMQMEGLPSDERTLVVTLQACGGLAQSDVAKVNDKQCTTEMCIDIGRALHADAHRRGFTSDVFVCSTLVSMYGKLGCTNVAESVFNQLSEHDAVLWNSMLSAYVEQGKGKEALQIYKRMQERGVRPNQETFLMASKACCNLIGKNVGNLIELQPQGLPLKLGWAIHSDMKAQGLVSDPFLDCSFVAMYGTLGNIVEAECVFLGSCSQDLILYNAMLSLYVQHGYGQKALQLYRKMQNESSIIPNQQVFAIAFQACSTLVGINSETDGIEQNQICVVALEIGKTLHADVKRNGFILNHSVSSNLIGCYGKCSSILEAENVFDGLLVSGVNPWNAMMSAYVEEGKGEKALQAFRQMQEEGVGADQQTIVIAFQACGTLKEEKTMDDDVQLIPGISLEIGQALHMDAWMQGLTSDLCVCSALTSFYSDHGCIEQAENVLGGTFDPDIVLWNAMLSAYLEHAEGGKALGLYRQMRQENVSPNRRTFLIIFQVCATLLVEQLTKASAFEVGQALHSEAKKRGFTYDRIVGSTLVTFYSKCGSLLRAEKQFDELLEPDVVAWNSLLLAYKEHGQGEKGLKLYRQMQQEGIRPNQHTLAIALQVCSTIAGKEGAAFGEWLQEIGRALHADVQKNGFTLDGFVGSSLVSMYSKCRSLVEAEAVFGRYAQHGSFSWNALLAAYVEQNEGERALQLYRQMHEEGVDPTWETLVITFHACCTLVTKGKNTAGRRQAMPLRIGQALHADAERKGFASVSQIGNALVNMYCKCGSITEAEDAFCRLSGQSVWPWNAMLSAYVEHGKAERALQLYAHMHEDGVSPNERTYVITLRACSELLLTQATHNSIVAFEIGQALHDDAWSTGVTPDIHVSGALVSLYSSCGSIEEAEAVFNEFYKGNVMIWNAMILAYVRQGQGEKALRLYRQLLQEENVPVDTRTCVAALQTCGILVKNSANVEKGSQSQIMCMGICQALHIDFQRKGMLQDVFVGSSLCSLYGEFGRVIEAEAVFDGLKEHNVVSTSALLSAYVEQGQGKKALQLYKQMHQEGVTADEQILVMALQACGILENEEHLLQDLDSLGKALEIGRALHQDAERKGFTADNFVLNTTISMYGKCGSVREAEDVFASMSNRDVVSWNVMLSLYVNQEQGERALKAYRQMQEECTDPDSHTIVFVLQACGSLIYKEELMIEEGWLTHMTASKLVQALHADARKKGLISDTFVGTSFVSTYGKGGSTVEADNVFQGLYMCDIVSWNSLLSAYVEQGQGKQALQLYRRMQEEGVSPDQHTFVIFLQACTALGIKQEAIIEDGQSSQQPIPLILGEALHADALKYDLVSDVYVGSTLVYMYSKCGSLLEAENVFENLTSPSVVTWNAMLSAYLDHDEGEKALQLYRKMKEENMILDDVTILCTLMACKLTGNIEICKELNFIVIFAGFDRNPVLSSILIRVYGSCQGMIDAQGVFDALPQRDIASWTACIMSHAQVGNVVASLGMLGEMQPAGVIPNGWTFISLLSACSRAGLIDKGFELFELMNTKFGVNPNLRHYVAMADLFGRAGEFKRVEDILLELPVEADWTFWMEILGACRTYGNAQLGKRAFDHAVLLKPQEAAPYVLLSDIYAVAGVKGYN